MNNYGHCESMAASGPRNLNDCCQSDPAVRARLEQLLVRLVAPNHKRSLSFRGRLTATDPELPDELIILNGSLLIIKLPDTGI